ncbi:GTPase hflX [Streptomyces laurentii]|uniref:GTPase hflX n=1 Tax=Streptomyces laurentii TaxID=39478 RepID=A0A160P2Q8_STRLU|nr:GTPase hflX [Streptomyces laurentii]
MDGAQLIRLRQQMNVGGRGHSTLLKVDTARRSPGGVGRPPSFLSSVAQTWYAHVTPVSAGAEFPLKAMSKEWTHRWTPGGGAGGRGPGGFPVWPPARGERRPGDRWGRVSLRQSGCVRPGGWGLGLRPG